MAALAPFALPLMLAGTAVSSIGTLVGGEMAAKAAETSSAFKAAQLDQAAAESRAAGQAQAFERRRQARLALSTLQARAAQGGDTTSPGILDLTGDIAQRGEYQALAEMYAGENRARGLMDTATATRMEGEATADAARTGSYFKAGGTLLSGAGGMYSTYATNTLLARSAASGALNYG